MLQFLTRAIRTVSCLQDCYEQSEPRRMYRVVLDEMRSRALVQEVPPGEKSYITPEDTIFIAAMENQTAMQTLAEDINATLKWEVWCQDDVCHPVPTYVLTHRSMPAFWPDRIDDVDSRTPVLRMFRPPTGAQHRGSYDTYERAAQH